MSELRRAQAAVAELEGRIGGLTESLRRWEGPPGTNAEAPMPEALEDALRELRAATGDGELAMTVARFRERSKMVDPVTSAPRFGPKTLAAVQAMLESFDRLLEEITAGDLIPRLEAVLARQYESKHQQTQAEETRRAAEATARQAQEAQAAAERARKEAEDAARRQEAEAAEQARVAELARLAQRKREERERQRQAEEAARLAEERRLAEQNAQVIVGVEGLTAALAVLADGISDEAIYRRALDKLHAVLAAICASPENAAFRHVPKENPHFHADIGRHEGGHGCLLAMGFKELEPEPGKRVFIMEEPDLSADMDKWSEWFDGLRAMKELLETTPGRKA